MNRLVTLSLLSFLVAGCGATSSKYARKSATHGELVWAFDGELQVTRNGKVVSDDGWEGLSSALRCVPRAADLASGARSSRTTGIWTAVLGSTAGLATVVGGAYVAIEEDLTTGLVLTGAGTALFATTLITGTLMVAHAKARGVDAVNIYNDQHRARPACAN